MIDKFAGERELVSFLEKQQRLTMSTWQRERTSDELANFVERRFALLDDAV